MSTTYEGTPTFEERVKGAQLIIIGRVGKVVDERLDNTGDQPQVQTVFQVDVENVLNGQTDEASINIRVVGGRLEKAETAWSVSMKEGDRVLLMLTPDYGVDRPKNMFVPYFSTCYPVTARGQVKLDEGTANDLASQKIHVEKATVKLSEIRSMISAVAQSQEKEAATLAEMEPKELLEMPYGDVSEMPTYETGGATPASPEGETEEPKQTE